MGPTIIIIIIVFIIIIYYYILYIISYLIIHYIIYIISYIIIVIIHYCHNIYKLRQINLFLIPYFSQETRGIMHSIIEKKQYLHLPLRIVGKYFIVIEFEFHVAKIQLSDFKDLQKGLEFFYETLVVLSNFQISLCFNIRSFQFKLCQVD